MTADITPPELMAAQPVTMAEGGPWAELRGAASAQDFAVAWLDLQARQLPGVRAGVVIFGDPDRGGYAPLAVHPRGTIIGPDLARAAEACLGEKRGVLRDRPALRPEDGSACMAWPILVDDRMMGVAAFELAPGGEALALSARRLQWGAAWLELLARRRVLVAPRRLADAMDMAAALTEAPSLAAGLQAMVSELARQCTAEWVALGLVGAVDTVGRIAAISHRSATEARSEANRATLIAMQEALDQRETIALPAPPGAPPLIRRAHEALAEVTGAGPILSLPLAGAEGQAVAVLTLQRGPDAAPLAAAEVEFLRLFATWIGPIIALKRREEMGIVRRLGLSLRLTAGAVVGPRHLWAKALALAVLVGVAVLGNVEGVQRVTAQARLEGSVQRAVTSPIAGYVAEVSARAGDVVAQGAPLARLDDRDLQVERARWIAERDRWTQEYQQALAKSDRSAVGVDKAHIDESQARIDLVDDLMSRVDIRSPIAGLVVAGDLDRMVGAPVQRGDVLYEVAPLDDYRVVLDIDESDVGLLAEGQRGELILTGLSQQSLPLTVTRLTPLSHPADGRNVFRIEARLDQPSDLLRPGMQGWAKVDVGKRPMLAILTGGAVDWMRLQGFRWLP